MNTIITASLSIDSWIRCIITNVSPGSCPIISATLATG